MLLKGRQLANGEADITRFQVQYIRRADEGLLLPRGIGC